MSVAKFGTAELAEFLREHGFKREKLRWKRTVGKVDQYVVLHPSKYGGGVFFVEIGFVFKELRKRGAWVIGGVTVHYEERLESVRRGAPKQWQLATASGDKLRKLLAPVLDQMAAIDSAKAMVKSKLGRLDQGFLKQIRAQLKAVSGDKKGALADLAAVAKQFASRGVTVDEQIEQLGLARYLP